MSNPDVLRYFGPEQNNNPEILIRLLETVQWFDERLAFRLNSSEIVRTDCGGVMYGDPQPPAELPRYQNLLYYRVHPGGGACDAIDAMHADKTTLAEIVLESQAEHENEAVQLAMKIGCKAFGNNVVGAHYEYTERPGASEQSDRAAGLPLVFAEKVHTIEAFDESLAVMGKLAIGEMSEKEGIAYVLGRMTQAVGRSPFRIRPFRD